MLLLCVAQIPYRCVVEFCIRIFQTKHQMILHIQDDHGLKLLLVDENEERKLNHVPDKKFPW